MKIENGNNFDLSNPENFEPIKSSNILVKFAVALVLLFTLGFATYWFYFKKDNLSALEESLGLEKDEVSDVAVFDNSNVSEDESFSSKDKEEGIIYVNEGRGAYFVIIGSFVDKDLAVDYANLLLKSHSTVYVINKGRHKNYVYVALGSFDRKEYAKNMAKTISATYPKGVWILLY